MPPRHLPVLDGWRGGAILLVLVGHFATSRGINLGRFGVELFFVLSGRLMAEILFVRATPLTTFFVRRASRIYPALICFVLAMSLLALATGHRQQLYGCLAAVTLTYNYYHLYFGEVPNVDHIWSLCVEEHSYILLGLVALLQRRFGFPLLPVIAALAALACLNGLVSTLVGGTYPDVYWRSDVRGASVLLGAAAYLKFGRGDASREIPASRPALLLLVGLLLNVNAVPDPIKYSLGTALLALAVASIPRAPAALRAGLTSTPLLLFGACSYSIYLWQQPFYVLHDALGDWFSTALVLPAIALGIASLLLIERPMRGYLNRVFDRAAGRGGDAVKSYATL
ncbi:acyltransferase family protein [Methylobacterium pseudosasicola]|uniref:Peptidoglycan/LPS O-acetylase OafA/YrhL, contains acyltransferase and SGNH-hydrolase domains n=1 Tax=Methylobacterium pseudosasicola TaxID=582667 RepID=A0A1I4MAM2_9HYPH|nr:acyltransferase [Methylobacterium pseudosasicola]SFM00274.1 Peptidoglycan/LPS O-acetylase OafA/YrhL, contains acyltransferase and SGNH-hydrolase domains [Methylobacterium pseudosasicola]